MEKGTDYLPWTSFMPASLGKSSDQDAQSAAPATADGQICIQPHVDTRDLPSTEREEERRETLEQSSLHRIQTGRVTGRQLVLGQRFEETGMLGESTVDEPRQKHRPLSSSSASKANKMRTAMPSGKTVTASPSAQALGELE